MTTSHSTHSNVSCVNGRVGSALPGEPPARPGTRGAPSAPPGGMSQAPAPLRGQRADAKATPPSPCPSPETVHGGRSPRAAEERFQRRKLPRGREKEGDAEEDYRSPARPGREHRKRARPGDSGQALPLPPRARRTPPPRPLPARAPHLARASARRPRSAASPYPPPARGLGSTSHPRPPLTCGCRLAAVRGGNFHSPLPGGSEFSISPPPHAAGDVPLSQASGGAGRASVTEPTVLSYRFLGSQGRHWHDLH